MTERSANYDENPEKKSVPNSVTSRIRGTLWEMQTDNQIYLAGEKISYDMLYESSEDVILYLSPTQAMHQVNKFNSFIYGFGNTIRRNVNKSWEYIDPAVPGKEGFTWAGKILFLETTRANSSYPEDYPNIEIKIYPDAESARLAYEYTSGDKKNIEQIKQRFGRHNGRPNPDLVKLLEEKTQ